MKKLYFLIFCTLNVQNIYSQSQSGVIKTPLIFNLGICGVIQTDIYNNDDDNIINGYGGLGMITDMRMELSESVGFLWGWNLMWLPVGTTGSYDIYKTVLTDVENIDDSQGAHEGGGGFGFPTYIAISFKTTVNNNFGMLTSIGFQCSRKKENQIIDIIYSDGEILRKVDFNKTTTDIGPVIDVSLYINHNNYNDRSFSIGIHGSLILFRYEETVINKNRVYSENDNLGFEIIPYISWRLTNLYKTYYP
jgi:hypothetical protein